jgi:hypothetical protein
MCSSAYRVALEDILQYHPKSRWNNYVFHFSDGDNWDEDNPRCKVLITQLLDHTAMVGYGEIRYHDEASFYGWANSYNPTWSTLHKELSTIAHQRFITVAIKQKEDVYRALQTFLVRKERVGMTPELGNAAWRTGYWTCPVCGLHDSREQERRCHGKPTLPRVTRACRTLGARLL